MEDLLGNFTDLNLVDMNYETWEAYYSNGTITIKDINIPEPTTYAAIFAMLMLGVMVHRRKRG